MDKKTLSFNNLSPQAAAEKLRRLPIKRAAYLLQVLEPDKAVDILLEIPYRKRKFIVAKMRQPERGEITKLLKYGKGTAGSIMTPRYVGVTRDATVNEALVVVRALARKLESIYYLYVLDDYDRLVGVLSLRKLILADSSAKIKNIMEKKPIKVNVNQDQETAASKVIDKKLAAIPVVSRNNRILGIMTYDDAARVLEKEASEDIERIGGAQPLDRPYLETSLINLAKKRIGWLFILFFAQTLTGNVLSFFQATLSQAIALSFFIPLLVGTGGNIGSQTVTLVIRALAIGQANVNDIARIVIKEARTGIVLGFILGIVGFFWARFFTGNPAIGATVAISLLSISIFAASVGALIPLLLHRFKLDPATASTPFISTIVDASGLVIYFAIAKALLGI